MFPFTSFIGCQYNLSGYIYINVYAVILYLQMASERGTSTKFRESPSLDTFLLQIVFSILLHGIFEDSLVEINSVL